MHERRLLLRVVLQFSPAENSLSNIGVLGVKELKDSPRKITVWNKIDKILEQEF